MCDQGQQQACRTTAIMHQAVRQQLAALHEMPQNPGWSQPMPQPRALMPQRQW
jgi:hypothetical protein